MNDELSLTLQEAIDSGFTEDELSATAVNKEADIAAASSAVSESDQKIEDNKHSIDARENRKRNTLAEFAKRRAAFTKKEFAGTWKSRLTDEGLLRQQEDGELAVLQASIDYGISLIEGLHRAKRAAALRLLESQRAWTKSMALLEAKRALDLSNAVIGSDPGIQLELKSSKCAAYCNKILELTELIAKHKAKEQLYGYSK